MECLVFAKLKKQIVRETEIKNLIWKIFKILKKDGTLSIHLVGEKKIKSLNKLYRGFDKVTDVLSFATEDEVFFKKTERDYGDIFICEKQIVRQAKDYKISEKEELVRMLVHGVLHLVGYDHLKEPEAKIMFDLQEKLLKKII